MGINLSGFVGESAVIVVQAARPGKGKRSDSTEGFEFGLSANDYGGSPYDRAEERRRRNGIPGYSWYQCRGGAAGVSAGLARRQYSWLNERVK